jgi:hypothetical protein
MISRIACLAVTLFFLAPPFSHFTSPAYFSHFISPAYFMCELDDFVKLLCVTCLCGTVICELNSF